MYVFVYLCMYVFVYVCMYVCMCVCMSVCIVACKTLGVFKKQHHFPFCSIPTVVIYVDGVWLFLGSFLATRPIVSGHEIRVWTNE